MLESDEEARKYNDYQNRLRAAVDSAINSRQFGAHEACGALMYFLNDAFRFMPGEEVEKTLSLIEKVLSKQEVSQ